MLLLSLVLLLLSNGLTIRPDTSILYGRIGLIVILLSSIATHNVYYPDYLEQGISFYGGLFIMTPLTLTFQAFIYIVCGIIITMTSFYPRKKVEKTNGLLLAKIVEYPTIINKTSEQFSIIEYTLIIIFTICGAVLLISSGDLASMYLCLELQSFSLYIISSIYRNSESSTGSALNYFLLGSLSSCFILLGIGLIYANTGSTNLNNIYMIISQLEECPNNTTLNLDSSILYSFLLISAGFLFKIAAAPFHWWSPDVYDGVPTLVTSFIANMGKIAIFILMVEFVHYANLFIHSSVQQYSWSISLSISCFFSLVIGTILGLTQTRIKKLLAYSTISHVGFMLLALTIGTVESYQAFFFYLIQYIITNLNAFMIIISIGFTLYLYYTNISEYNNLTEKNNSPIQLISQLKGYFVINPVLALCFVVTMFSFIGLPPLPGFFAKQMVLSTALDNNKIILVLLSVFTSVIGAVYYLTVIKTVYFETSEYIKSNIDVKYSLSNNLSIILSIINILSLLFIFTPNEIINTCDILSQSFGTKYDL
jgi:NADH-ubiquinone oxidoreductase chain 2